MNPVMAPVIADNIFPHTSGSSNAKRMFMVTIPNTPCTKCQLQLTQFMSDNPNSGYYECADIVIDDAATGTPYVCGGGGMSGGGGTSGGGGEGSSDPAPRDSSWPSALTSFCACSMTSPCCFLYAVESEVMTRRNDGRP